jgi:dienelactone hydrolase
VLRDPTLTGEPGGYVICGFSLGAQTALDLLTTSRPAEPAGVVLVGCVVEAPRTIMCGARSIDLVYGGRDAIAYVGDGNASSMPIFPEQYGARSAELLVVRPWQEVRLHLRSGAGHHLTCGSPAADRVEAAWLARLVRYTLSPGAPLP